MVSKFEIGSVVVHTFISSTEEVEAGRFWFQGQLGLYNKFQVSWGFNNKQRGAGEK